MSSIRSQSAQLQSTETSSITETLHLSSLAIILSGEYRDYFFFFFWGGGGGEGGE